MSLVVGDCRATLTRWAAEGVRVQCVVTSPPYWGLRDYGTAPLVWDGDPVCPHEWGEPGTSGQRNRNGQNSLTLNLDGPGKWLRPEMLYPSTGATCLRCGAWRGVLGLEPTPELYVTHVVEVFRLVRDVLADDGTCWINLGDSYASGEVGRNDDDPRNLARRSALYGTGTVKPGEHVRDVRRVRSGLKPKDLVGIPWMVAKALQAPYYTSRIKNIEDRIWLAAMLDAEGCLFIHRRKAGQHNGQGYYRQNDSFGPGVEISNTSLAVVERIAALVGQGSICSQGPNENQRRKQTIYRWNLRTVECREFVRELYPHLIAKRQQARILYGCPSSGERATAAHTALIHLHRRGQSDVDFPELPSLYEPGWWLRSDIIWSKNNPMPESVTDRPTKAHEYLFLLSKRERYYYDAAAIREMAVVEETWNRGTPDKAARAGQTTNGTGPTTIRAPHPFRNRRSVWTIATAPYPEAHFATFPPDLVTPCILAGSRPGDVILDPFMGAGTVAMVAEDLGRRWLGCELSEEYAVLCERRTRQQGFGLLMTERQL